MSVNLSADLTGFEQIRSTKTFFLETCQVLEFTVMELE